MPVKKSLVDQPWLVRATLLQIRLTKLKRELGSLTGMCRNVFPGEKWMEVRLANMYDEVTKLKLEVYKRMQ